MHILLAIVTFSFLIVFHELGHMWVARRMGMRVDRFSLGFGPTLLAWRRGETEYVLSVLPLGGYVTVAGVATEEKVEAGDAQSYANKPAWRRFSFIAAGPAANYLLSFVLGVGLLMSGIEVANLASTRIGDTTPGDPAAKAGVLSGDEVRAVGGIEVHDWQGMKDAITKSSKASAAQAIPVVVVRDGQMHTLMIQPIDGGLDGYRIGVLPTTVQEPGLPIVQAVPQAVRNVWGQTVLNASMVWKLITRQGGVALSGPVGIFKQTAAQAKKGMLELLELAWALSIAVGFMNLLPIPGLDGGRLAFLMYEVVSRRRMDQRIEGIIHMVGIAGLLLLIVVVSYGDFLH